MVALIVGTIITIYCLLILWWHISNPYARLNWIQKPYSTIIENNEIHYIENFRLKMLTERFWDKVGYVRQAFLIIEARYLDDRVINAKSVSEIIAQIHKMRFDPAKPYLISGDQFSVLYPRNLGVFYNQLLNPKTALSEDDWDNRQSIYLQSVLYAIDGLYADPTATTIIPLGPKHASATHVHPGDVGSDAVFGLLYAIDRLLNEQSSSGKFRLKTQASAKRILQERRTELYKIVTDYLDSAHDPETGRVKRRFAVSSARDGVTRDSSFYDNMILWKTLELADKLGIISTPSRQLRDLARDIDKDFWNKKSGHYSNDMSSAGFSGDWLIGYVCGFFDLKRKTDLQRAVAIVDYIRANHIAEPFPLKYQKGYAKHMPLFIKLFLPSYGSNAIWSYWGAQYITLLADLYESTHDRSYIDDAKRYLTRYERTMLRDHGYAETFSPRGRFLKSPIYRSIRITGWVVQHEYAAYRIRQLDH